MSKRSDKLLMLDMQEAIARILEYTQGLDQWSFIQSQEKIDSVVRNIQIIGEASNRTSLALRNAHPEIEWPAIIGMRHRLVHDYFEIEEVIVWRVVSVKLPILKEQVRAILESGIE